MGQGLTRDKVLDITGVSKHILYYKPNGSRTGRAPSQQTLKYTSEGVVSVDNEELLQEIRRIQLDPDTNYGYRKTTVHLMQKGYVINHKKVHRLMKESQLLKEKRKFNGKSYVKYRKIAPEAPLHVLEMDIKQVWITEHRRHAYILTVLDTFTRVALHYSVGYSIKKREVKAIWEKVIVDYLQEADLLSKGVHIEVRNDNGPQFSATEIQEFFKENYIHQVFTHPYTPQENGHIESFHNILKHALGKQIFWSLSELEKRLEIFYTKYNTQRLHSSIAYLSPMQFWKLWEEDKIKKVVIGERKYKFKLLIPYQKISGNGNQREVSCFIEQHQK